MNIKYNYYAQWDLDRVSNLDRSMAISRMYFDLRNNPVFMEFRRMLTERQWAARGL